MDGLATLISAAFLGVASMATAVGGLIVNARRGDAETRREVKKLRRDLINAEAAIFRLKSILARHGLMSEFELEHGDEEPPDDEAGTGNPTDEDAA